MCSRWTPSIFGKSFSWSLFVVAVNVDPSALPIYETWSMKLDGSVYRTINSILRESYCMVLLCHTSAADEIRSVWLCWMGANVGLVAALLLPRDHCDEPNLSVLCIDRFLTKNILDSHMACFACLMSAL
ncbi:uncharacterized protein BKA55DRAFT_312211 [Fusarium redolens]|uniref:Uncharacterized protein n=1 Tax=Fusarium redolens TaxID=48865 RepID=A0A9P9KBP3_FUSRE|nr:uncharacterized protein BKA55DRAFT_312211 [Fusarium redolens]KAH7255268.1 hypothetical protein BKA55DRAFT_312211 [Fusarium redolens]